jgi:hypothetical protein
VCRQRCRRRKVKHPPDAVGREEAVDVELVEPVPVDGTAYWTKVSAVIQGLEVVDGVRATVLGQCGAKAATDAPEADATPTYVALA